MRLAVHTFKSLLRQLSVRLVVAESDSHLLAFELTESQPAPSMPHTRSQGASNLTRPLDSSTHRAKKVAQQTCEPTAKEIAAADAARARLYGAQGSSQVCSQPARLIWRCPPAPAQSPLMPSLLVTLPRTLVSPHTSGLCMLI